MRRRDLVRGEAVARGAAAGAPPVVLAALLYELVDREDGTPLAFPLALVLLGGLGFAGYVAAVRARRAPVTNGALAALFLVGVLQALAVGAVAVRGKDLPGLPAVVFRFIVAYAAGVVGAVVATRHRSSVEETS